MEENPFPDLKIDSSEFLDTVKGRSKCSVCQRSRKYYCYTCYLPVPELSDKVPRVKVRFSYFSSQLYDVACQVVDVALLVKSCHLR